MRSYVASLNNFYLSSKQLWELDFSQKGFEWIYADESDRNLVAFRRYSFDNKSLIVLLNFSGDNQTIPLDYCDGHTGKIAFETEPGACKLERIKQNTIAQTFVTLSRFSGAILFERPTKKKIKL